MLFAAYFASRAISEFRETLALLDGAEGEPSRAAAVSTMFLGMAIALAFSAFVTFVNVRASGAKLQPRFRPANFLGAVRAAAQIRWLRFRGADHQFVAVVIALMALLVALLNWLFPLN
ncbi:hypothetical protein [Micromonospora chalcea]|uniref:hypothetical protein n=1 Tax=Micromonospora chalcea TaxID=1874 RepID=UPI000F5DE6FF|nr:hypothetical protein [Micromonospora chalcea]